MSAELTDTVISMLKSRNLLTARRNDEDQVGTNGVPLNPLGGNRLNEGYSDNDLTPDF